MLKSEHEMPTELKAALTNRQYSPVAIRNYYAYAQSSSIISRTEAFVFGQHPLVGGVVLFFRFIMQIIFGKLGHGIDDGLLNTRCHAGQNCCTQAGRDVRCLHGSDRQSGRIPKEAPCL
ncbi:hypothetical protein [Sinorhizobium mexicanum]|uniref:Uncharacterized protein n=1 Tax=Sinorhizobium mexicanum TaxID=375549 RepID=A0A859R498_9HYPH|nr:hypothetical protein [Sinorhizobium mexicanum]MBP1888349.1 hypothetical protein [Sinorhizobium mexicanum]QLL64428.1 hypothetical protein FKV68_23690 [Sinorhizobium mexicanum]